MWGWAQPTSHLVWGMPYPPRPYINTSNAINIPYNTVSINPPTYAFTYGNNPVYDSIRPYNTVSATLYAIVFNNHPRAF